MVRRGGPAKLRIATLVPLCGLLWFLLGFNGRTIDENYSARPLAEEIASTQPHEQTLAVLDVRRDMVYGLAFYRNQSILNYSGGVPAGEHILVVPMRQAAEIDKFVQARSYEKLFTYAPQGLNVYKVSAAGSAPGTMPPQ
jgi:hypothetical protein